MLTQRAQFLQTWRICLVVHQSMLEMHGMAQCVSRNVSWWQCYSQGYSDCMTCCFWSYRSIAIACAEAHATLGKDVKQTGFEQSGHTAGGMLQFDE